MAISLLTQILWKDLCQEGHDGNIKSEHNLCTVNLWLFSYSRCVLTGIGKDSKSDKTVIKLHCLLSKVYLNNLNCVNFQ